MKVNQLKELSEGGNKSKHDVHRMWEQCATVRVKAKSLPRSTTQFGVSWNKWNTLDRRCDEGIGFGRDTVVLWSWIRQWPPHAGRCINAA